MAFVRRLQQGIGPGPNPETTSRYRYPFWAAFTDAGETVSVEKALELDTVWAAVRARSFDVGQLPLIGYKRLDADERELSLSPVARVLREPNREHSAMNCWGLVSTHLNTWGNFYVGKTFELLRPDVIKELWPWHPKYTRLARKGGEKLIYLSDPETGKEDPTPYTRKEFIHGMGFSLDGLEGLSPIAMARHGIGADRARQRFANRFWRDGAVPSGFLTTKDELGRPAQRRIERDWNRRHRRRRLTAVLESGMTYQALSMPLADAQFIESEQHSVEKIARWFNMPPSRIFGTVGDSMTYKTVEGEFVRYMVFGLQPELAMIEQALGHDDDLFPRRPGMPWRDEFPEFKAAALLRSDQKSKNEAYSIANGGRAWMLPSEQRRLENLPPITEIDDHATNPPKGVSVAPHVSTTDTGE
jgi:HK97 family phage portal protein